MIASIIDGRIRIRDNELREAATAEFLKQALLAVPGITDVGSSLRVGSLLIIYDPSKVGFEKIREILDTGLTRKEPPREAAVPAAALKRSAPGKPATYAKRKRQVVKTGMLATLTASLAAAALDLKKLHIAWGLAFLGFLLGGHLYEKRRLLFT